VRLGEQIQYQYILENLSDKAVPIAIPDDGTGDKVHFGWPAGGQPFLEPKWQMGVPQYPFCPLPAGPLAVQKAQWPPLDGFGEGMRAWLELPAGHRIVWNQDRLPGLYFGVGSGTALGGIQAHWLVGPNRWISSPVVPVKVVDVPMSGWKNVFNAQWSSYGYGKDMCSAAAYVIPLEGSSFLFMGNFRVTEVMPDDRFEHQIDKEGTNMGITIIGPTGRRKVYYHLRHGLTLDTPWPIGPVSLFYPKPEPIPPAELDALRNVSTEPGFSRSASSSACMASSGPSGEKRIWLWIAVSFVSFMLLGSVIAIRVRRTSARSSQ
jgi:hypothetical protein